MRTAKIILNEQEIQITELKIRQNAKWVQALKDEAREPVELILTAFEVDLQDENQRAPFLAQVWDLVGDAQDTIADLAVLFAPEHKDLIEDAYASEVMAAFIEMVKLAVPFEWEPWLERLQSQDDQGQSLLTRFLELGERAQATEPS
jgi:hypothetical protein